MTKFDDACPTCGPICGMREFAKRYGAELDDEDLRRIEEAQKRRRGKEDDE